MGAQEHCAKSRYLRALDLELALHFFDHLLTGSLVTKWRRQCLTCTLCVERLKLVPVGGVLE
jgi:hypothetical protein